MFIDILRIYKCSVSLTPMLMSTPTPTHKTMQLIIIFGMLGLGKSVVLIIYEDLGFYCIDNLFWDLFEVLVKCADDDEHGVFS